MLASRCLYEATMEMERLLLHRIKIFFFFKDRKNRNVCGVARSNAFKICYPIQEGRRGRINYIELRSISRMRISWTRVWRKRFLYKRWELRGGRGEAGNKSSGKEKVFSFVSRASRLSIRNPPPYGSSFNGVHECARWECRRPRNTDLRRVLIHFFEISVPFFAERYEKLLEMARIPDVSNCYDASDNFNMHRGIFQIVGNIFHWFLVYFFWSIFLFSFKALYTIRR